MQSKWEKKGFRFQFLCSLVLVLLSVLLVCGFTLWSQSARTWTPSLKRILTYAQKNTQFSVGEVTKSTARLLSSFRDTDTNNLAQIANALAWMPSRTIRNDSWITRPPAVFTKVEYREATFAMTLESGSMFSPSQDPHLDKLLGAILSTETEKIIKPERINVIFCNPHNPLDFMIKTIPGDPSFEIVSVSALQQWATVAPVGKVFIPSPYLDNYRRSSSPQVLVCQLTKIVMPSYDIIIQFEVGSSYSGNIMSLELFEPIASLLFVSKDPATQQVQIFPQRGPFEKSLNYSKLTTPGPSIQATRGGAVFYIFTQPLESYFELGKFNIPTLNISTDTTYSMLYMSQGESFHLFDQIKSITVNLTAAVTNFLLVWDILLFFLLLSVIWALTKQITNSLDQISLRIRAYQEKFSLTPAKILGLSGRQHVSHSYSRLLYFTVQIVSSIRSRIKKNRNPSFKLDVYPLNFLHNPFMRKYAQEDFKRLQQIREQVMLVHQQTQQPVIAQDFY